MHEPSSTPRLPSLLDELLGILRERSAFELVMVTRVEGDDWHVVAVTENDYAVTAGDVFRWSESICSRMAVRGGDRWTLDNVDGDAVAACAPVRRRLSIGSYAGAPIRDDHGALLGTVCAIDPCRVAAHEHADLFAFAGRLAAHAFAAAGDAARLQRDAERSLFRASPGRPAVMPAEAWNRLLLAEAERTAWTGEHFAMGLLRVVRQSETSPARVQRIVDLLADRLGDDDVVSRLGSNRVGVLQRGDDDTLRELLDDLQPSFEVHVDIAVSALSGRKAEITALTNTLETELVGASAAAARSTSQLIRYHFCDDCGRKGRYRSAAAGVERCKYCGVVAVGDSTRPGANAG